jgi:hypothetical protein
MITNYYAQRDTVPTAFVTKGRQRVKQFQNSVYLKNGDEFEIELFNPTTSKVLAKISLNGKSLGSGIILRPAERVFLERYFDEAKKFLFETYVVEGNNSEVEKAIRLNGVVEVEFYEEYKAPAYNPYTITYSSADWTYKPHQPGIFYHNTGGTTSKSAPATFTSQVNGVLNNANNLSGNVDLSGNIDVQAFNCSMSFDAQPIADRSLAKKCLSKVEPVKETGRVEKGSVSDQAFVYDNTSFNSYTSWRTKWHILPDSEKPRESHDLKCFCPNCGAKQKRHTHKFCPICGTKYE